MHSLNFTHFLFIKKCRNPYNSSNPKQREALHCITKPVDVVVCVVRVLVHVHVCVCACMHGVWCVVCACVWCVCVRVCVGVGRGLVGCQVKENVTKH